MKRLSKILAIGAVVAASSSFALADPIVGGFSLSGSDSYTSSTITFAPDGAAVGANGQTGKQGLSGTFATYLTDGDAISFTTGPLSYSNGSNTLTAPSVLFTVKGDGGQNFTFTLTDYTAKYDSGTLGGVKYSDLLIYGTGLFDSPGFSQSAGEFHFYSSTSDDITQTTFQTSAGATGITPEPSSLLLLGTGLFGAAGAVFLRRRSNLYSL